MTEKLGGPEQPTTPLPSQRSERKPNRVKIDAERVIKAASESTNPLSSIQEKHNVLPLRTIELADPKTYSTLSLDELKREHVKLTAIKTILSEPYRRNVRMGGNQISEDSLAKVDFATLEKSIEIKNTQEAVKKGSKSPEELAKILQNALTELGEHPEQEDPLNKMWRQVLDEFQSLSEEKSAAVLKIVFDSKNTTPVKEESLKAAISPEGGSVTGFYVFMQKATHKVSQGNSPSEISALLGLLRYPSTLATQAGKTLPDIISTLTRSARDTVLKQPPAAAKEQAKAFEILESIAKYSVTVPDDVTRLLNPLNIEALDPLAKEAGRKAKMAVDIKSAEPANKEALIATEKLMQQRQKLTQEIGRTGRMLHGIGLLEEVTPKKATKAGNNILDALEAAVRRASESASHEKTNYYLRNEIEELKQDPIFQNILKANPEQKTRFELLSAKIPKEGTETSTPISLSERRVALKKDIGRIARFLGHIGLLKHVSPQRATQAGTVILHHLARDLEGIPDTIELTDQNLDSLSEKASALKKELDELRKDPTFAKILEANPELKSDFGELISKIGDRNEYYQELLTLKNLEGTSSLPNVPLSKQAQNAMKIHKLTPKSPQAQTEKERLLRKYGPDLVFTKFTDDVAGRGKRLSHRTPETLTLDKLLELNEGMKSFKEAGFGGKDIFSFQDYRDLFTPHHNLYTEIRTNLASKSLEKLSEVAPLPQQGQPLPSADKMPEQLKLLTTLVNNLTTPEQAQTAYKYLEVFARTATKKDEMTRIDDLFQTLSNSEIGKGEGVKTEKMNAFLAVTRMPRLCINPDAIPEAFAGRALNYNVHTRISLKGAPKNADETFKRFEKKDAVTGPDGRIVQLTEAGLKELKGTAVFYGPASAYIDQNRQISDFFLAGRSGSTRDVDIVPVAHNEEALQTARIASFGKTRGVVYYGQTGRLYERLPETNAMEFLFINTENIDFESQAVGPLEALIKESPPEIGVVTGDNPVNVDPPLSYDKTKTPPSPSLDRKSPEYDQTCKKLTIGFFSEKDPLEVTKVLSLDAAVDKMTKMIEDGVTMQDINREFNGLGVQVKVGGKTQILPMEVLMRMRFEANQATLSFIESVGERTGKQLTREAGAPDAFLKAIGHADGKPEGHTHTRGQLMTRLDMLSVQAMQKAGEDFAHLGALVVNDYGDNGCLPLWDKILKGKVVKYSDVYHAKPTAKTSKKYKYTETSGGLDIVDKVKPYSASGKDETPEIDMTHFIWTRNQAPDKRRDYIGHRKAGEALEECESLYSNMTTTQSPEVFRALAKQRKEFQRVPLFGKTSREPTPTAEPSST